MQAAGTNAFVDRMIGVARLDERTYEAIEHDQNATPSALLVVVLAAIASGIGALDNEGGRGLIGGLLSSVIGWAAFAFIAYVVGSSILAGPTTNATWGQLLRTLGFAQSPLLLQVVGWIPVLGWLIAAVASIWFLVTSIVALRHALEVSTGRAIAIGIVSFIAYVAVAAVIGIIFGIGALVTGAI